MLTVDAIARSHDLHHIDALVIDTEGHDGLVIRGADRALRRKLVRVLEFEYHSAWQRTNATISDTLRWLAARGYSCFWAGNNGRLAPAAPEMRCEFEFNKWSNVVCTHERELTAKLLSLAIA